MCDVNVNFACLLIQMHSYMIKSCFKLENRDLTLLPWGLCCRLTKEMETADLKSALCFSCSFLFYKSRRENFLAKKVPKLLRHFYQN